MAWSRVSPPRTFVWDDCMTSQKKVCVGGYSQFWQHLYQSKHWCDNQSLVMILMVRKNCLKRCMITLIYILPGVSDRSISRQVLSVCECSIRGFVPSSWNYSVFRHRESKIAIEHLILHSEWMSRQSNFIETTICLLCCSMLKKFLAIYKFVSKWRRRRLSCVFNR